MKNSGDVRRRAIKRAGEAVVSGEPGAEVSARSRVLQAQRDAAIAKMVPVACAPVVVRGACTAKSNGELAELAFVLKAASLGFGVSKPYGDSERYDFLVDSGERVWKVQVRSTFSACGNGYYVHSTTTRKFRASTYRAGEIDVLAAYVAPENIWYVVPVERIIGVQSVFFYPSGCRQGGMYEDCREDWKWMAPRADRTVRPGEVPWICCAAEEDDRWLGQSVRPAFLALKAPPSAKSAEGWATRRSELDSGPHSRL